MGLLTCSYFAALIIKSDIMGDILSPIVSLIMFIIVFYEFFIHSMNTKNRIAGAFISVGLFTWSVSDIIWLIGSLVIGIDPMEYSFYNDVYLLTNIFIMLAVGYYGYLQLKSLDFKSKILDIIVIYVCLSAFVWDVIFDSDIEKANILFTDKVSMIALGIDTIIISWAVVWFFSMSEKVYFKFDSILALGTSLFAITDFIFYYAYFYGKYVPNSFIDGLYMFSFIIMAGAAFVKERELREFEINKYQIESKVKINKEWILLSLPLILLIVRWKQTNGLTYVLISIVFYYMIINHFQKNMFKKKLKETELEFERKLDDKVEIRTKEIINTVNNDVITGLYNKNFLESYIEKNIINIKKEEKLILFFIEIERFKNIRKMYGNYTIDSLLRVVGFRFKDVFKVEEYIFTYYENGIYSLVIKDSKNEVNTEAIVEKIINLCSDTYYIEGVEISVMFNIGSSVYPDDSNNKEEFIKNTKLALEYAFKQGDNTYFKYSKEYKNSYGRKKAAEKRLKKMNFDKELQIYYQPQLEARKKKIVGFEALIRWKKMEDNFIPPIEIIESAEEAGIMSQLGLWIINNSIKQLSEWKKYNNDLKLSINISLKQISDIKFIAKVQEIFSYYDIKPESVIFEIAEKIQSDERDYIKEVIDILSEIGFVISIDNFGSGYSSLNYLKNIHVDRIKLAKDIVSKIDEDLYSYNLVKTIIRNAKEENIKVLAEGIERMEQWKHLIDLQCDEVQGFYIDRPLEVEEAFEKWINFN